MMKPNKQGLILCMLIGLFMVLSLFIIPVSAEEIPVAAREAGENGYKSFLKLIPLENLKDFNFSDQDEIDQAVLGNPFNVYTITPERILNYSSETPLAEIISPISILLFPVISKGEVRTFLMVDLVGGEWRAVGIGSSGLAKEWDTVMKDWPSSEGYEHTYVRIFQANADFITLSHLGKAKMIPLNALGLAKELAVGGAYNPSEIIINLQEIVRQNLRSPQSVD